MNEQKALWKASGVFAPDYPRQSSDGDIIQAKRQSRVEFCEALTSARENGMPGYYSVYSFPRGHSQDGNIPKVDCIFIDLDVEGSDYNPNTGDTDFDAWRRDMSALLARARMIAKAILDADEEHHFRAVLSGHKGLHLYLDFPTIAPTNGDLGQFKNGLKAYGEDVMSWLDSTAGGVNIDRWVDVDASDLGRLARHPNTIHHGAAYDDETRWCVPITIDELADLRVEDYLDLTAEPRWIDGYQRNPSVSAGDKVVQSIRNASSSQRRSYSGGSTHNQKLVKYYDRELNDKWYGDTSDLTDDQQELIEGIEPANPNIELEDIPFITSNKPCIEEFRKRDDAFNHGNASHEMEISIIGRLVDGSVPRDVIHEFFAEIPGYSEATTDEQIDKIIARQYAEFNCETILAKAPMFCLGDGCKLYRGADDLQK
jgi:hypothetical protein